MGASPVNVFDVAIAGGGLVGRALALALARSARPGFRIALIDPCEDGGDERASALALASRRLLDALGLWDDLRADAQPILAFDITDSRLEALWRPEFLSFESSEDAPSAWMVENASLAKTLTKAVDGEQGVLRVRSAAAGFEAGPHRVDIRLASGEALAAKLLVAADGRRSRLRDQAGIKCVRWDYPQIGIVTTVAHQRPHQGRAVQHFLPAGPFAILPLTGNRASLVWTETRKEGEEFMRLGDPDFLAALGLRFGRYLGELRLAGPRASYPLGVHIARRLTGPRFALVGDAARGLHPLAGQGLNAGFRDVAALAETLTDAARLGLDIGDDSALEAYQRWRRFDGVAAALAMDGLNVLFSNDSPPLRLLRDVGLGLIERAPALKRLLTREAAGLSGKLPRLLRGETI